MFEQNTNALRFKIPIQILVLILFFSFPILFQSPGDNRFNIYQYLDFAISQSTLVVLFYLNFHYLIDQFLFKKKLALYILINLLTYTILAIIVHFSHMYFFKIGNIAQFQDQVRMPPPSMVKIVMINLIINLFSIGFSITMKMAANWYKSQSDISEMEKMHSQFELQNLKSQLNPHFLFNTLNNIYALTEISSEQTRQALSSLGELLRYVLYDNNQERISLIKEVRFVKDYCDLMSLRLNGNVTLKVDLLDNDRGYSIAPLLFISLIENAFKHGVSPVEPSHINISIHFKDESSTLMCIVKNSIFPKDHSDKSGSGIGINNLNKRLKLIYDNNFEFNYGTLNNEYVAEMMIKL